VTSVDPAAAPGGPATLPLSEAKARIVDAAAALFAEHGVGGTSLQMIADAIGVTKAAVYHQFKAKDEIVIAAAQAELDRLKVAIEAAEATMYAGGEPDRAREVLVNQIVTLAVERRRMESTLTGDPVLVRYFASHAPFRALMERLYRILAGEDGGPQARTRAAMLTAAIGGAVMHPLVADLDDDVLRAHLLHLARRFLDLPELASER
jgi:AcrR family transcriptional regulator